MLTLSVFLFAPLVACVNADTAVTTGKQESTCASLLPKDLSERLAATYIGWRVLERSDLNVDDQTIWDQQWGSKECPGVAIGNFRDLNKLDYAVAIVHKTDSLREEKLLFADMRSKPYRVVELHSEKIASNFAVVRKGLPGQYKDVYDRTTAIDIRIDTIIYEHIEASAIAFIFRKGAFEKLLVSD